MQEQKFEEFQNTAEKDNWIKFVLRSMWMQNQQIQ
jgi:hypothetical protein